MAERNDWLDLFTPATWEEFLGAGGNVSGFRESRSNTLQKIKKGQPNLNIPLFLVAPEDRREKVFAEVNRPTFSRLDPRLAEICRFISFEELRERLAQVKDFVQYLKADFLEELSEACDLEST